MRQTTFPVANQIQRLGTGILCSITADSPFAGDACMKQGTRIIAFPDIRTARHVHVHQGFIRVDRRVFLGFSGNHNIRRDGVVIPQSGSQRGIVFAAFSRATMWAYCAYRAISARFRLATHLMLQLPGRRWFNRPKVSFKKSAQIASNRFPDVCPARRTANVSSPMRFKIPPASATLHALHLSAFDAVPSELVVRSVLIKAE